MSHHSKKFKDVNQISPSKNYHCPRCRTEIIKDYGDSFDCPNCRLEFEKADCDHLEKDDSAILAIEEKIDIFKAFDIDPHNPEHKRFFEEWEEDF